MPHSIDTERLALGAILLAAEEFERIVRWLAPSDFFLARNRSIFTACIALLDRGVPPRPLAVIGELERRCSVEPTEAEQLERLVDPFEEGRATTASFDDWSRQLRNLATRRAGIERGLAQVAIYRDLSEPLPEEAECEDEAEAEYVPFPVEVLPSPLSDFVREASQALGCDTSYIALPSLSMLAAAIGNSRRARLKRDWCEPSILWTACVGESGTLKSPSFDAALRPAHTWQRHRLREYRDAQELFERERLEHERDLAAWRRDKGTEEPPPEAPRVPVAQRLLVSDATVESVAALSEDAPRGLLLYRDELAGWFGSFDAYKQSRSDAAHWLELHGGRPLVVDRKAGQRKTIYVPRASCSIAGGIQPGPLIRALGGRSGDGREHWENGLCARLLLAMPPRLPRQWTEAEVPEWVARAVHNCFMTLIELPLEEDENGEPRPRDIPLTADAKRLFASWVDENGADMLAEEGDFAAAMSKLEGGAARLALVLHLARWAHEGEVVDSRCIDAESMNAGIELARWFRTEAERVYRALTGGEKGRESRELAAWIQSRGGEVTARDLVRGIRRIKTSSEAETALDRLVAAGFGKWTERRGSRGPARRFFRFEKPVDLSSCRRVDSSRDGFREGSSTRRHVDKFSGDSVCETTYDNNLSTPSGDGSDPSTGSNGVDGFPVDRFSPPGDGESL